MEANSDIRTMKFINYTCFITGLKIIFFDLVLRKLRPGVASLGTKSPEQTPRSWIVNSALIDKLLIRQHINTGHIPRYLDKNEFNLIIIPRDFNPIHFHHSTQSTSTSSWRPRNPTLHAQFSSLFTTLNASTWLQHPKNATSVAWQHV